MEGGYQVMSNTVDSRVVEMRFDNQQFESNVKTSMSTLDKLKSSLSLTGISNGLTSINEAAKRLNFDPIGNGIEFIKLKFSMLDSLVINTFNRISNSIITTGKNLVSAFTIDPVKTGLQEYETQINAVQTILANTESKGSTLQDVNRALNELNAYADKTIYNFTEMTRNIGTFTAAGLDLKTSVSAIQGIANVAAVSGSTSQQASTAMYQLSQALSSGTVKLQDWNSVVNAGMGGQVLQDALKETSRECVNVAKNVNAMSAAEQEAYRVSHGYTEDQLKNIKEYAFNVDELIEVNGSFRESLTTGWITADVLARTLNKFTKTGAVEYISEMTGASITSVQELQNLGDKVGWDSKQVKELALSITNGNEAMAENVISTGRMASTAEDAATKVKTFSQLMDTLKEAAQSGWTQTWQLIIGDFGEAKELFTSVSDTLGAIIGESANARNELLSGGLSTGWKQLLNAGINDAEKFEEIVKDVARTHSINIDGMIDSEHDFQDALKNGWLTTQMLEESIRKYGKELEGLSIEELKAKGYTLEDAQAYAKLKEELDNGSLSLDDFRMKIMRSSGRENIIEGLKNSFEALMAILKPIGDAFRQVFPPATAEQLYSITEKFLEFTKTLKPTSYQLVKLGETFRGIFSVFDIAFTVIKQLGSAIFNILGNFKGFGTSVLEVTASIGDWLFNLRNSVKETDIFGGAVEKINGFLQSIIEKFKNVTGYVENFKKGLSNFSNGEALKSASIFEKIGIAVGKIGNFLKNVIVGIKDFGSSIASNIKFGKFEGFIDILQNVWTTVQKICGSVVDALVGMLRNGDIKAALDTFNSSVIGVILLKVKDMLKIEGIADTLSGGFLDQIKSVFSGLTGMFDSVQQSLQAWQQNLQADTLTKIASAIGILALSLVAIAAIEPEKLTNAIIGITTLFGELVGSMAIFNKMETFDKSFGTASTTMIKLSASVLVLSFALAKIGSLSVEEIAKGLVGVTILLGELVGVSILLSKYGGKVKKCGMQMILMAVSMEIFADACSKFGNLSWESIFKGVSGIGIILLEFVGFQKLLSMIKPKKMLSSALSLVLIGSAMEIFADVCSKLGAMEVGELAKASMAMAVILAIAAGFGLLAGLSSGMMASSAALLIMSAGLEVMADVCSKLGAMDWESLGKAGVAITGILALAAGFGLLAGLAPGMITSAAALLIMAGALAILAPVMETLGNMQWEGILKGLVGIAGVFAVLGVAGLLLQPLVPTILALGAAVTLLGVGCLACGAGVMLLSAGLTALLVGAGAGVSALIAVIVEIIALIPLIVTKVGEALILLLELLGNSGETICKVVVQIGLALIQALEQLLGPLLELVLHAIVEILRVIAENIQPIVEYVIDIVIGIIEAVRNKIPEVVQVVGDLLDAILLGIVQAAGRIVQAGIDLVINLIDGLAIGIEENVPRIKEALDHLGSAMLNAFCEFFGIHSPSTVFAEVGGNLVQGLINGVGEFISNAVSKIKELCTNMVDTIKNKISEFKTKGAEIITNIQNGIKSKTTEVVTNMKNFAENLKNAVKNKVSEFKTIGTNIIDGLKNGIKDAGNKAVEAAKTVSSSIKEKVEKFFDINSPSKVFHKIGEYLCRGLADGMTDTSKKAENAAENMSKSVTKISEKTLEATYSNMNFLSNTMNYGSGAMEAYLKNYGKFTDSIDDNNEVIKNASTLVANYGAYLYEHSDAYKTDMDKLRECNDELEKLANEKAEIEQEMYSSKEPEKYASKIESVNDRINTATQKLDDQMTAITDHIMEAYDKVHDKIADTVKSAIDIMSTDLSTGVNLLKDVDEDDDKGILGNMRAELDSVKSWRSELEQLKDSGLCEGLLKQLEELGPQGASKVKDFLQLTADELSMANEMYAENLKLSADTFIINQANSMAEQIDWAEGIRELLSKGFDQGIIQAIGDAGQKNGQKYLEAFLSMSKEDVEKVNEQYAQTLVLPDAVADDIVATYIKAGEQSTNGYANSIVDNATLVEAAFSTVNGNVVENGKEDTYVGFNVIGMYGMEGWADGILKNKKAVLGAGSTVANELVNNVRSDLDINSPSRVFKQIGTYVDEGFANGITGSGYKVKNSISTITTGVISNAKNMITSINDVMQKKRMNTPLISPIINMDGIDRGAKLKVSTSIGSVISDPVQSMSDMMFKMQNSIEKSNEIVSSSMDKVRAEILDWKSNDNNKEISLYVDSKKMASTLARPMSKQFNVMSKRGI